MSANANAKITSIITRKSDGSEVRNDKVQAIVVTIPTELKDALKQAKAYWGSLGRAAKKTLAQLSNLGLVLREGKLSVNANNQVFGKWRATTFPGMTARFCSYAIQLNEFYPEIIEAFDSLGIENKMWSNPESVLNAYRKISKTEESPPDSSDGETATTEDGKVPEVVVLETLTPEQRIETLGESVNMVIETFNRDALTSEQVKDIVKVLSNAIAILTDGKV